MNWTEKVLGARSRDASQSGFTLVELLVVILIIGILLAIALPTFLNQQDKANNTKALAYLNTTYKVARSVATGQQGDLVTSTYPLTSMKNALHASEPELTFVISSKTISTITPDDYDGSSTVMTPGTVYLTSDDTAKNFNAAVLSDSGDVCKLKVTNYSQLSYLGCKSAAEWATETGDDGDDGGTGDDDGGSGSTPSDTQISTGLSDLTGLPAASTAGWVVVPWATQGKGIFSSTGWAWSPLSAFQDGYTGTRTSALYYNSGGSFSQSANGLATEILHPDNCQGTSCLGRFGAIWAAMPDPVTEESGYQLSWSCLSGTTNKNGGPYSLVLSKFTNGTATTLDSESPITIPSQAKIALVVSHGTVSAWINQNTGSSSFLKVLEASDTTYTSGYATIQGGGNSMGMMDLHAGPIPSN